MRSRCYLIAAAVTGLVVLVGGCNGFSPDFSWFGSGGQPSQDIYGPSSLDEVPVNEPVADFSLRSIQGDFLTLADFRGKIVVLQFGSSTSPEYLANIEPMGEVMLDFSQRNVVFLTVYSRELNPDRVEGLSPDVNFDDRLQLAGRQSYATSTGAEVTKPALPNRYLHYILVDELPSVVGGWYGYGPGEAPNPVFIIDETGTIRAKNRECAADFVRETLKQMLPE